MGKILKVRDKKGNHMVLGAGGGRKRTGALGQAELPVVAKQATPVGLSVKTDCLDCREHSLCP